MLAHPHRSNELAAFAARTLQLPAVSFGGVTLVDARGPFPLASGYRPAPLDAALLIGSAQHHDAGTYPDDPLPGDDAPAELARLAQVYAMHVANGWGGIAYHTYGFPSGRLYLTRDPRWRGTHVAWRNHQLLGHCSAGSWTDGPPPLGTQLTAALASLAHWAMAARFLYVAGHRDWALTHAPDGKNWATECPGAAHATWVPRIPEAMRAIIAARAA